MHEDYDEGEHCKAVYAHFGRAYYLSSVLETGVALALLTADFLAKQKAEIERKGRKHFDSSRFESEFDTFLHRQHAQTFGNLMKRMQQLTNISDALKAELVRAKECRDFLAHHFFRERAEEFETRRGRDEMIAELRKAQVLFEAVDEKVSKFRKQIRERLGIREEVLQAHIERYIRSVAEKY